MKPEWTVRLSKKSDAKGILKLMKDVYPDRKFDEKKWTKWWKWMFTENPAGAAKIWVADHNGKIAGQYPFVITDMKVGDKVLKTAQNIELMTHPDYRRQGMFVKLERTALKGVEKNDIHIAYGFPNAAAYPGHLKSDWFDVCPYQIGFKSFNLKKILNAYSDNKISNKFVEIFGNLVFKLFYRGKKASIVKGVKISKINSFDNRFDDFWKTVSNEYQIITVRNKDYLNWRYVKVPDISYTIFAAEENNKICGYIVLRCVDEDKNLKSGSIFDILVSSDRPEIASLLISKAIDFFKKENVDYIICFMIANKKLRKIFRKSGFMFPKSLLKLFADEGIFIAYSSHPEITQDFFKDENNWFVQLGDSDSL